MIEETLIRIAVALEAIAGKATIEKPAKVEADVIPGPVEEPTNIVAARITSAADLRAFAQKAINAAGDKANNLITFIKNDICMKFTPKEPKLLKIPDKHLGQSAQMIYDWCLKNNVSLE